MDQRGVGPIKDDEFEALVAKTCRDGLGCKAKIVVDVVSDPN